MKRLLLLVLFAACFVFTGYSQKIDFTIKTDSTVVNGSKEYSITVEVSSGTAPFSYYLCDKVPWVGGVVLEQQLDSQSSLHIFRKLAQCNNYVVFVKGSGKDENNLKFVSTRNSK